MAVEAKDTEKLRQVVKLLPLKHCGKCGYDNCGQYAVALVGGKVSPVTCKKSLDQVNEICAVLGVPVPANTAELIEERRQRHAHGHHGHGHHGKGQGGHHGHGGNHHGGGGHHGSGH